MPAADLGVRRTKTLTACLRDESSPGELNLSLQKIMGYSQAISIA